MKDKLKPCPFCGDIPEEREDWITCPNFDCPEPMPIKQWQKRPIEDALRARIAELEAALKKIVKFDALDETDTEILLIKIIAGEALEKKP